MISLKQLLEGLLESKHEGVDQINTKQSSDSFHLCALPFATNKLLKVCMARELPRDLHWLWESWTVFNCFESSSKIASNLEKKIDLLCRA